jgi:hypothetical protein
MSRITVALSIAVLGLATSTAWFAFELRAARAELSALCSTPASAALSSASALPASTHTAVGPPPTSFKISKPALSPDVQPDDPRAYLRASIEAQIPRMRALLEDPDKRAEFLRDSRKGSQRDMPRLAEYLKLTPDEYGRLLDLLAQQQLRYQDSLYECALDSGCDPMPASGYRHAQTDKRELDELLGSEKAQRFADYGDNSQERRIITQLRGEFPDSLRLSDVQSEKLIEVLGEERRRIAREWQGSSGREAATGSMSGYVSYSRAAQNVEQLVAEAGELQRRQRERAAQILSAGQLEIFTQKQKDALDIALGGWEYQAELAQGTAN